MAETVEVKLKLPKAIVQFIKEYEDDLEGYLESRIMESLRADLEYDLPEWGELIDKNRFLKRYPEVKAALYHE